MPVIADDARASYASSADVDRTIYIPTVARM
jgi:hypothetical protein